MITGRVLSRRHGSFPSRYLLRDIAFELNGSERVLFSGDFFFKGVRPMPSGGALSMIYGRLHR